MTELQWDKRDHENTDSGQLGKVVFGGTSKVWPNPFQEAICVLNIRVNHLTEPAVQALTSPKYLGLATKTIHLIQVKVTLAEYLSIHR